MNIDQRSRSNRPLSTTMATAALVAAAMVAAGCGGGGNESEESPGQLSFTVNWEQPATSGTAASTTGEEAVFDTPIPPSVSAIRFVLRPAAPDPPCCIVIARGSDPFEDRRLLLADITPGLASLEVHGYPVPFAPAPSGVTAICDTRPAGQGEACSTGVDPLPSFGSDEIPVDVLPAQPNVVDVDVYSLPFLLDLDPEDEGMADSSRPFVDFTVVDANHQVDSDIDVRIQRGAVTVFADIEDSDLCSDTDGELPDCSDDGELEVQGRIVSSRSPQSLSPGTADLRITASNTGSPPRDMESNTTFDIPLVSTTTTSSTTVTIGEPELFCLKFSVPDEEDLVGISFDVLYGATGGEFNGSGEEAACESLLTTTAETTLTSFNDDEDGATLSVAAISADTIEAPVDLAVCEFEQVPPLDLLDLIVDVTEATAPDLSPADVSVEVTEVPCPQ